VLERLNDRLDAIREIAAKDILVVAGTAKSGTTWVQRMLDTHPEIYCPGEGKFGTLVGGLVKAVTDYNRILTHANQAVYSGDAYYVPWDDDHIAAAVQFLLALAWAGSRHKDLAAVRYIGDKDTDYQRTIEVWRDRLLPDARFVHVIRDGRDTAVSNVFHRARSEGRPADFRSARFREFLEGYARDWAAGVRRMRDAFRERPDRCHEVRYEDLLAEPEVKAGGILAFLGVDDRPEVVARIVAENAFQRLSGGRERGQEDRASFFRKGVAGDWRAHFDDAARARFAKASGGLLEELGYAP
jgi:hypothetical protein